MKHILVLYYSQTGQLKNIVDSICAPFKNSEEIELHFCKYEPEEDYSFPWSSEAFFDAFPESVNGIPCKMKTLDYNSDIKYDLIILAYQVWYLSPSIPTWSLLSDKRYAGLFKNSKIITLLGVRNMWLMAHKKLHNKLEELGASHIGNIVLTDPYPNLISVVTVIKWMTTGKQGPYKVFPRSGVDQSTINEAKLYGDIIKETILKSSYDSLQEKLVANKAVSIDFALQTTERSGIKIFGIWSKFILKKGGPGNKNRRARTKLFSYYLMLLIFIISPIPSILFSIIGLVFSPIINQKNRKIALLK